MNSAVHCHHCKWWQELGCYNTNWTGKMSDPATPVCEGISYQSRIIPKETQMSTEKTTKPEDYLAIAAWGKMLGSYGYYVREQQRLASEDGAPINAVYEKHSHSGRSHEWVTLDACAQVTQDDVNVLVEQMRGS